MELDLDLDKLESIFDDRYRELHAGKSEDDEFFVNYCDAHGIVMVHHDWVRDAFNEPHKDKVCIMSPEDGFNNPAWLLVPISLAEKTLVLGYLP